MTFTAALIKSLVHNMLKGLALIAFLVVANATTGSAQAENPEGVNECWNPHTAQIFTVQGECPVPANPYK